MPDNISFPDTKTILNDIEAYRLAFENAPVGIVLVSPDGRFLHCNKAYCNIVGYTIEELVTRNFQSITHPEDLSVDVQNASRLLNGEINTYQMEKRYIHKNGNWIWVQLNVSLAHKNNICYFVAHAIDISQSRQLQKDIQTTRERLNYAIERSEHGLWIWNVETEDVFFSSHIYNLIAVKNNTTLNSFHDFVDLIHPEDREKTVSTINKHLVLNTAFDIDLRFQTPGSIRKWFKLKGKSYKNESNKTLEVAGVLFDITKEKEREAVLFRALEENRHKNEELEQYAYIVSHDLQEPLRTIASYIQLLSMKYQNQIDDTGKKYLDFILEATTKLRTLIKDLLEYAKVNQKGKRSDTSFHTVIKEVLSSMKIKISASKASIKYDEKNDTPLYGNQAEIARVFQNLISNSIKFCNKDKKPLIRITYHIQDDGFVKFNFTDNGVGIAEENFEKLFKMFYRIPHKEVLSNEGNGIGLATCKRIIEKYGGKIEVKSKVGKGTTFVFTLPVYKEKDSNESSNNR